jgi:hypothetical protein
MFFLWTLSLWSIYTYGQGATEVYLADITIADGSIQIASLKNISENTGYDNQPSFPDDESVMYSRTRQGQTDIAHFSLKDKQTTWLTDTPAGSEYSPLKIPEKDAFSAIRLDTSGLQRLYAYPLDGDEPYILVQDLKIGYHLWLPPDLLVCTVLVEGGMDLAVVNFKDNSRHTIQKNVGRSLLRIPATDLFSYISLQEDAAVVKSMDPDSGATDVIIEVPEGVQDICWLPDGTLICGKGNKLLGFRQESDTGWRLIYDFSPWAGQITRLAINPSGTRLALVAEIEMN